MSCRSDYNTVVGSGADKEKFSVRTAPCLRAALRRDVALDDRHAVLGDDTRHGVDAEADVHGLHLYPDVLLHIGAQLAQRRHGEVAVDEHVRPVERPLAEGRSDCLGFVPDRDLLVASHDPAGRSRVAQDDVEELVVLEIELGMLDARAQQLLELILAATGRELIEKVTHRRQACLQHLRIRDGADVAEARDVQRSGDRHGMPSLVA